MHWLVVLVLVVGGILAGNWISEERIWIDVRYAIYQRTFDLTHPHGSPYPKRSALVLVQDDEYWKGELAGRAPIKRDYLARLIRKIDAADAAVIGIDFDLRSPTADGSLVEHPDYLDETRQLCDAIRDVGSRRAVVLPAILGFDAEGNYVKQSTIFGGAGFDAAEVREGYIQLPYDLRRVPVAVELKDGKKLDSFAGAIVAAADATAYARLAEQAQDALPFGSYMSETAIAAAGPDKTLFSAGEVLQQDTAILRRQLGHKIVVVGGAWSANGYHSGRRVDSHLTPAGLLPGSFVHVNFVEALLGDRTYKPVSESVAVSFDVLLVLAVAILMALPMAPLLKAAVIAGLGISFAALTYFFIQNLGLFLDFFVPVVLLAGHLAADKVFEWRHQARQKLKEIGSGSIERDSVVL